MHRKKNGCLNKQSWRLSAVSDSRDGWEPLLSGFSPAATANASATLRSSLLNLELPRTGFSAFFVGRGGSSKASFIGPDFLANENVRTSVKKVLCCADLGLIVFECSHHGLFTGSSLTSWDLSLGKFEREGGGKGVSPILHGVIHGTCNHGRATREPKRVADFLKSFRQLSRNRIATALVLIQPSDCLVL